MNKKYYWLKLKEDFFEEDTISWIEEQENGIYYINFYLKLCLKSLKSDGILIRNVGNMLVPYDAKQLSKITNTDVDTVRVAMELFKNIGLIEILESGEIYLNQLQNMVGSETNKAQLMRDKRQRDKEKGNIVTKALPNCYTEIEKEKEKEKEKDIDKEKEKDKKHKYGEFKHVLLTDKEKDKLLSELGEHKFNLVIKRLDEYIEETGKKYKNHNLTIRRWVIDAVTKENPQLQSNRTNKDDGSSVIFDPRRDLPGYWSEDDDDDPSLVIFDPTRDL